MKYIVCYDNYYPFNIQFFRDNYYIGNIEVYRSGKIYFSSMINNGLHYKDIYKMLQIVRKEILKNKIKHILNVRCKND